MVKTPSNEAPHYTPTDPGRVDTTNPVEVRYWCTQFDCTESELMEALERVGGHVAAVREYLEKQPRRT